MAILRTWRSRARLIRRDTYALYLAVRDPRTPLIARILAGVVVAYALSPLDLIPDFIPILGSLDDLILIPLGMVIVVRLIPPEVMEQSRGRADVVARRSAKAMGFVVVGIWLGLLALVAYFAARVLGLI